MFKKTKKLSDLEKQAQLKDLKVVTLLYFIKIAILIVLVNLILVTISFIFGALHTLDDGVLVALCTLASFLGSFIQFDDGPHFFFRKYFPPSLVAIQKVINQQIEAEENNIKYFKSRVSEIHRQHKEDIPLYCKKILELENNIKNLKKDALLRYGIIF